MLPLFLLVGLSLVKAQSDPVSIQIPATPPNTAAPLDPALISLSIEQDRWPDWAGEDAPNAFFINALDNLALRTGVPPFIRIGADSEDHTQFDDAVSISETIFPPPTSTVPYPEASNITVGPAYYALAAHLPPHTRVIWGVNLGAQNITNAFLQARAIRQAFEEQEVVAKDVRLVNMEIGNEPDLYGNNGLRDPASWDVEDYVEQWTSFAANVSPAAGISSSPSSPKFFGLAFSHNDPAGFSFSNAVENGLLDSPQGALINEISQHKYFGSGVAGVASLASFMSKSAIRGNVSGLASDIEAVKAKGLDFVLGETNSYFSHGAPGVSNAAGAAIWLLDYTLLAASMGVKRLYFHEGVGYRYNLIQPVTLTRSIIDASPLDQPLAPHVQPAYYGALVAAETVGVTNSSSSKIVEVEVGDDTMSAYAVFDSEEGAVKRVVLIDSEPFLSGEGGERGGRSVLLSLEGRTGEESVEVKRLIIGHADDTSGLTWAGQSFDTPSAKPVGGVTVETLPLKNGSVSLSIRATEVVLVSL